MARSVLVLFFLCSSAVHAAQDCQENECPITVNSMLQVKDQARIQNADGAEKESDLANGVKYTLASVGSRKSCPDGYAEITTESGCKDGVDYLVKEGQQVLNTNENTYYDVFWKEDKSSSQGTVCVCGSNGHCRHEEENPDGGAHYRVCKAVIQAPTTPMQFVCSTNGRIMDPRGGENPLPSTECDSGACDHAIAYANQVFFPNNEAKLYYSIGSYGTIKMSGNVTAGIAAANAKMREAGCHVYFKDDPHGLKTSCDQAGVDYKMGHSPYAVRRRAPTDAYPNGWLDYTTAGKSDYSSTNMMSCFNNQFLEPMCSNKTGGKSDTYPCKCGYSAKATTVCTAGQLCTAPYFPLSELFSYSDIEGSCAAATQVTSTLAPTAAPTEAPTAAPTLVPTAAPTASPTDAPTQATSTWCDVGGWSTNAHNNHMLNDENDPARYSDPSECQDLCEDTVNYAGCTGFTARAAGTEYRCYLYKAPLSEYTAVYSYSHLPVNKKLCS